MPASRFIAAHLSRSAHACENDPRPVCGPYSIRGPWRVFWLITALLIVPTAFAKEGMDSKTRIEIIRTMLREVGVTKVALPRGKHGARVDATGKIDQSALNTEMHLNGAAMKPGAPAEITKIEFKQSAIVFEINGGGKNGHWYQHIQVDMGGGVSDPNGSQQTMAYGSSVILDYGKPLPDLTVPEIKKMLSGVLDFERHTQTSLYSPNLPPKVKDAIKNHKVIVGMDRDAVLSAKGSPDRRVREVRNGSEEEDWIYGTPPHVLFVTFDGDVVASVKQY